MLILSTEEIFDKTVEILLKFTDIKKDEIKHNSKLGIDLGLTSFDMLILMTSLEENFNITVNDSVISKIETVDDIVKIVDNN
jgi:acyl carrier protein